MTYRVWEGCRPCQVILGNGYGPEGENDGISKENRCGISGWYISGGFWVFSDWDRIRAN